MKIKNILFWGLLWGIIYFVTNNINLFTPHELPLFPFEKNTLMNEWWMIPYVSWVIYTIIFCLLIKKRAKKFTLLMTGLVLIHALVFIVYPVEYPRTYDINSLCLVNKFLLSCDNPQNCLPSLHVSFIFLTLLISPYLGIVGKIRYLFIAWGIIIVLSVIFVKQHYIIDILGSLLITSFYFYFVVKKNNN
jgi:membrane-associated phospholipid phosphatase